MSLSSRHLVPAAMAACLIGTATHSHALAPSTRDARQIVRAVTEQDDGDRQSAKLTMTLVDASGRKRVRGLVSRRMKFDQGTKVMMLFAEPADMRNTGFLLLDYTNSNKDDDQWLYLPSLHKSTRISSSDRSGSFLGSDLSYADLLRPDTEQYEYKLLEDSTKVDGDDCWRIEARPRNAKLVEQTGYLKTELWISKQKLVPLQSKMWVREGKRLKYVKYEDVRKVSGYWTTHKVTVRSVRGGKVESTTVLQLSSVRYNDPSVTNADFTERRLEKGL